MKKRALICLLILSGLLLSTRALASAGAGESLISLSYLNQTFLPALEELFRTRAAEGTRAVYDEAVARVDELGRSYLAEPAPAENLGPEGWTYSAAPQVQSVKRGDVITVSPGSTVLWSAGTAEAGLGLVDATSGSELDGGGRLSVNHRYINGNETDSAVLTVLSDAAQVLLEGYWTVEESGEDATHFTDLVQTDWYYDPVRYAVDHGLFSGVDAARFAPGDPMDRSMLALVLYRMEGSPDIAYAGVFSDVAEGRWYTEGVEWAAENQIVSGVGEGRFGPAQNVTREQIASMLYRYARDYLELDVSQTGDLSRYTDSRSVSSWAQEGMLWAVGAGLFSGDEQGRLLPGNAASRAEVAAILQRFQTWAGR